MTGSRVRASLVALFALTLWACVTRAPANTEMAGVAPQLSVERFLQAANARDFEGMVRVFGTHDGPIKGERRDLELRMSAIAEILAHQDYRITGQQREAGREYPTTRVMVSLIKDGREIKNIPFLVVATKDGGWIVEEVDLALITRG